jgi:hypothetical protein
MVIWYFAAIFLAARNPSGTEANLYLNSTLPVEGALGLIIGYRLMYRLNRTINGMPPIKFSTQHPDIALTSPVASARVLVGLQNSVPTAGNLSVIVRVGPDLLQLVEILSLRASYPSYEIPKAEISSVQIVNNQTLIKLHDGTTIHLAHYLGAPLEKVLSGEVPLTEATSNFVHPDPKDVDQTKGRAHFSSFLFGFNSLVLLVVSALVARHQWPYASGALVGAVALDGLLWRSRHTALKATTPAAERSPAGLSFIVVLNIILATIFVFVGYLVKGDLVIVFAVAMATLLFGLSMFILFIAKYRPRNLVTPMQ